jgi:hypothetical protein
MKSLISTILFVFAVNAMAATEQVSLHDVMNNTQATHFKIGDLKDFRVVIPGVLYRGGNAGGGHQPIPQSHLDKLCASGFSQGMYMYADNYDKNAKITKCEKSTLEYNTFGGGLKDRNLVYAFLKRMKDIIENKKGPMYVHCWNGWHASGEMSAFALMQFCGLTKEQGQAYWNANVPKRDVNKVLRPSRFEIFDDLRISSEDQARICPR